MNKELEKEKLIARIIQLATKYGRYGYRRVTALLKQERWQVNHKRVERIWRIEGLKVPQKQPKRGRLWLTDGSCVRLRPQHRDHVWSYDFVMARTSDGRSFRILTLIDEYTRECLALLVSQRITCQDVIDQLFNLFVLRGTPEHIRSDNGTEFTAREVFTTLTEARVLIKEWMREYNQVRPHSALGYRSPAPEARIPVALT